jgi:transposase
MPVGLTVNPGNVLDVTHFDGTLKQMLPLLPKNAAIVFDNGAYSENDAKLPDSNGLGFMTRLQLNSTDDNFVKTLERTMRNHGTTAWSDAF